MLNFQPNFHSKLRLLGASYKFKFRSIFRSHSEMVVGEMQPIYTIECIKIDT